MFESIVINIRKLLFSNTAKNFYWVTAGNFGVVLSGFLFTVLTARAFNSPSSVGLLSAISTLVLIFTDIGDFGMGAALTSFIPPKKGKDNEEIKKISKTVLIFQLFIIGIITSIFLLMSQVITQNVFHLTKGSGSEFILICILGTASFIVFNFFYNLTIAHEKFSKSFILLSAYSYPKIVILLAIFFFFKLSVILGSVIFILGPVVGLITGLLITNIDFVKIKGFYSLKKLLGFGIFIVLNKLMVTLFSRLDILMLSILSSSYNTGIYTVASRISFLYPMLGASLGVTLGPRYSKISWREAVAFSKNAFLIILLMLLSIILIFCTAPIIIKIIYGDVYNSATGILRILLLTNIPFLLGIPVSNFLIYTFKKPQATTYSSLLQLIIIILGNLFLIPRYGAVAPAYSIAIASSSALIFNLIYLFALIKNEK